MSPGRLKGCYKGWSKSDLKAVGLPGGALPCLKLKYVLTQKNCVFSHFPISKHFLPLEIYFQRGKKSQGYMRRDTPALARGQQANLGSLSHWSMNTGTFHGREHQDHLWSNQGGTWVYVRAQRFSMHIWSITFYASYRGRRTRCCSIVQSSPELFGKKSHEQAKPRLAGMPDASLLPTG